ncbi:exodeoxyribonuclease V subunit alpha [Arenimonas sp.]|uniref:exodeoxyribonuclease V subunit alpha n=1 Tax=Arenimonas sp. TaxID=1872635 RepID=UPI0039E66DAF
MSLLTALYRSACLRTIDHALAESLRRLDPETPDDVLAALALASRASGEGHSCLPLAQAQAWLAELVVERDAPTLPALMDWIPVLQASHWIATGRIATLEGTNLFLRRYWNYETLLAAAVHARVRGESPADRLLLITGGPGTGKTTQAARALAERVAHRVHPPRIALAAPTGKAASRLNEVVQQRLAELADAGVAGAAFARTLPIESATLHRLLGWRSDGTWARNADDPLPFDLIVVDEASMVDLPMMLRLFEATPVDASLVLIGDRDQLPSVQAGDVLAAMCDAFPIATTQDDATTPRLHLTRVHRQADDTDIHAFATLVRDGRIDEGLDGLQAQAFRGVIWRPGSDRDLADHLLAEAVPAYRALQQASDPAEALAKANAFRVLTAVRDGAAGSIALNARLAQALDPGRRGDALFHGRLLLITQNSYRHGLYNGDVGIAWTDETGDTRVWFDSGGGLRAWRPSMLPGHEDAFALTVHKAQGSEFDRVLLALPEHGARVLSRELLYTGLTRCRREIVLWASEPVLRAAIERRAQRWSGLAKRLSDRT